MMVLECEGESFLNNTELDMNFMTLVRTEPNEQTHFYNTN